jgi:hypothetical protein
MVKEHKGASVLENEIIDVEIKAYVLLDPSTPL